MLLDIHTHILPGVDDGASNIRESRRLLGMLKSQKVDAALCTPHMYVPLDDAKQHVEDIKAAFETVANDREAQAAGIELFLGYEVAYFPGMSHCDMIRDLTLGGTDKLLLEMRLAPVTDRIVDDILETAYRYHIVPVFAHLEGYIKMRGFDKLLEIIESGDALAQVTAAVFPGNAANKPMASLIEGGYVSFIGSDCHSVDRRPPMIDEFFRYAEKKFSVGFTNYIEENNSALYDELKAGRR